MNELSDPTTSTNSRTRLVVWVAGALVVLSAFDVVRSGLTLDDLGWSGFILTASLIAVAAIAVAVRPVGRAVALGLALSLAGSVAATAAAVGMPVQDGIGERDWGPVTSVRDSYRLGIGDAELDLTDARGDVVRTAADVAIGSLRVVVPAGAAVDVEATADVGRVEVLGRTDDGTDVHRRVRIAGDGSRRTIRLELHVGIGNVEVVRAAA